MVLKLVVIESTPGTEIIVDTNKSKVSLKNALIKNTKLTADDFDNTIFHTQKVTKLRKFRLVKGHSYTIIAFSNSSLAFVLMRPGLNEKQVIDRLQKLRPSFKLHNRTFNVATVTYVGII